MMLLSLTLLTVLIHSVTAGSFCHNSKCPAISCEGAFTPPGGCCVTCPDCRNSTCQDVDCKGALTPPGSCCPICPDCSNSNCKAVDCSGAFIPPGGCCSICPASCTYEGKTYQSGKTFKDRCNACSCHNGIISCTNNHCGCWYNGKTYAPGESFHTSCSDCTCKDAAFACTQKPCGKCIKCWRPDCSIFHSYNLKRFCQIIYARWLQLLLDGRCC